MSNAIRILNWGMIPYVDALARQKELVKEVAAGGTEALILCEHPLTITLGRKTKADNIFLSHDQLARLGYTLIEADRGGDVTLHMPGQLVVYPVMDLKRRGRDIMAYLRNLEKAGVDFLAGFGIVAKGDDGKRGVWVGPHKIASIGVGVSRWVTYHGIAININNALEAFRVIRPCGLDARMASVSEFAGKQVTMPEAYLKAEDIFKEIYGVSHGA